MKTLKSVGILFQTTDQINLLNVTYVKMTAYHGSATVMHEHVKSKHLGVTISSTQEHR